MKEAAPARLAKLVAPLIDQRLPNVNVQGATTNRPSPATRERGGGEGASSKLEPIVTLLKDRARTLNELADEAMLFYLEPHIPPDLLRQHLTGKSLDAVREFAKAAEAIPWTRTAIAALNKQLITDFSIKMPLLAVPLRVAVTGRTQTPSIDAVLELIGRDTVLRRLRSALDLVTP
jgi:glutamyl-tRNA synthetase